jgi:hypothetical protein
MAEYDKTDSTEPVNTETRMAGIRKRFAACEEAERDLRKDWLDDLKFAFIAGHQWDGHLGEYRGKRPKYEFNKIRPTVKQVVNDNRKNTPTIKIRATEDANKDLADIRQGLIRSIESRSKADEAYDWGAMYAIACGFGCWTITTEYADEGSFDQDIYIRRIQNPLSVWFDPAARELDRRDARYAFIENRMTVADFKAKYPKAQVKSFDSPGMDRDHCADWFGEQYVRIAEYWYKESTKKTIHQLSDGRVVDAEEWGPVAEDAANPPVDPQTGQPVSQPVTILRSREVTVDKVKMEIVSGAEVLEGPTDWAGKFIPIVPVWGDFINVEGKDEWYGMVRMSRDAQTLYNYNRSNLVEIIANQPRSPWLYTAKQIAGYEAIWQGQARDNPLGLPYNPDPTAATAAPTRDAPPQFPAAMANAAGMDAEDIKSTTGVYDASLGAQGNETSGKAIQSRQRQTDTTTFDYSDNVTRAIQYTGEIIDDLIPHIIDTERELMILGEDGSEDYIRVNKPVLDQASGQWVKINDMQQGRYAVTVTTGPSYATTRMETLDAMMQLVQAGGPLQPLAFYLAIKNMDLAGIDDILEGARRLAVNAGLLEPGEQDTPPQPPPPNPKDVADAKKSDAQAAKYGAEAEQVTLENQRMAEEQGVRRALAASVMQQLPTQPSQSMFQQPPSVVG